MKIEQTFTWSEDESYGVFGWIPKGYPDFNAAINGALVAHDTFEHTAGSGDVADELMAIGACLYIRVEGDYWANFKGKVYPDLFNDVEFTLSQGNVRICRDSLEVSEDVRSIACNGVQSFVKGYAEDLLENELPDVDNVSRWIQKGYNNAKETFGDNAQWRIAECFYNVEQTVDKTIKGERNTGDILKITVDSITLDYSIDLIDIYDQFSEENEEE